MRNILLIGLMFVVATPAFSSEYASRLSFLDANKVLTESQLKGENYQVDDTVRNDGFLNYYTLSTNYGSTSAQSTAQLNSRIDELNALVTMEKMERTTVFKDALVQGVKGVGEGVVNIVTSPIETSKDIAKGTGQFFSNIGNAFVSDDPDQDNALKVIVGYDVAKRQYAYEFGINPYTEYQPAVIRLGEIAQAATAGGITPKAAFAAIGGGGALAANISGTMRSMQLLVKDNPPEKLSTINTEKLLKLGVSDELIERFINNYAYDPYEKTLLVGELESMNIPGAEFFITKATLVNQKPLALLYRSMAQMMGEYHRNVEAVTSIASTAGILNLICKDGRRVVLMPLDHVFWTERVGTKIKAFDQAMQQVAPGAKKELWVTGQVDPSAREQLKKRGWVVVEEANSKLLKNKS